MIRETLKIKDIVEKKVKSPLDVSVIPNHMGINLCSVDSIATTRLPDGQLVDLTINFLPDYNSAMEKRCEVGSPNNG